MARLTTFKFALDLTATQQRECQRYAGASRKAFNWGLALVKERMSLRGAQIEAGQLPLTQVPLSRNSLIPAFNAFKLGPQGEQDGIASWYTEVSKYCFEEALVDLSRSLSAFFKSSGSSRRRGFPGFRKRGSHDSFRLRADRAGAIALGEAETARRIKLPKLGWLTVFDDTRPLRRLLRPGPGGAPRSRICHATICRKGSRWYVSITIEAPDLHPARSRIPEPGSLFAGVDLGINCYAVLADENGQELERIAPLKPLRAELRKLRRASRSHSRKKKGSSGRRKASQQLARIHSGIANKRNNFLHRASSHLVETQDRLVIEDLAPSNLVRNRRLSREISDASWAAFRNMLEYKASWTGVELVVAPRSFASSKTCSGCGSVKAKLLLSERQYLCESCGMMIDRDTNAAINLARYARVMHQAAAGRVEALNAGGARSAGRAGPSRFCETACVEAGTVLVELSAGTGQPRRLP